MVCKNGHGGASGINQRLYTTPPAQPAQEPAFWLNEQGQLKATRGDAERHSIGQKIIPLYTTPPKREWVGILEANLKQGDESFFVAWREGARWADAYLKEKNNG
jgi:hypothetical protein